VRAAEARARKQKSSRGSFGGKQMARSRWDGRRSCRTRRSGRGWTGASADASESVLPVAGSARFHRRVRVQGNRPRVSKLRANGVRAEQEQHAGDATRRGDPTGGYAGVPTVFLQHTRVSRGGLAREQENPEVRGEVGIGNQSGSIVSSHKSTTFSSSYSSPIVQARPQHLKKAREPPHRASSIPVYQNIIAVAKPTAITTGHHEEYPSSHPPPTTIPSKLLHHPMNLSSSTSPSFPYQNLITVKHFSSPILLATGIHFPPVLIHNQGYPKVCSDPLNLPNTSDPFAGTSLLSSHSLFSPTRDLIASI
jgi:hypothetical protein